MPGSPAEAEWHASATLHQRCRDTQPIAALTGVPCRQLVREPRTPTAESRPGAGSPARGGGNPAPPPAPTRQPALAPARR